MPEPTGSLTDVRLVDGRPRAFRWRGRPYVVTRVERSWPSTVEWWRADHAAPDRTNPPATGADLPHWLVEAVGPGGEPGLYDVHINADGATLVTPHGRSSAA